MGEDTRSQLSQIIGLALIVNITVIIGYFGSSLFWIWHQPQLLKLVIILAQSIWILFGIYVLGRQFLFANADE